MANRIYKVYWDIDDEKGYNDSGEQLANNLRPYIYAKENVSLDLNIVTNWTDENDFEVYTGFEGESISCTATIDNDFNHVDAGVIEDASLTGAITSIEISGLKNIPTQTGYIQLKNAANQKESVDYTAVIPSGNNLIFTVSKTLNYSYVAGDAGNVSDPALIKTLNVDIDKIDKDTGRFIVSLDADSSILVDQIEGKDKLTNTKFEFKVKGADTKLAFVALFDFNVKNTQDDDGQVPPPTDSSDFYDKDEIDAKLEDKMDKQPTATTGNIAEFDSGGQAIDSGFSFADFGVDLTSQSTALLTMTGTTVAGGTAGTVVLPSITGEIIDIDTDVKTLVSYTGGAEVTITAPENLVTLFSIDKDLNLFQSTPPITCEDARDRVFFSAASTLDGVNVDAVADTVATTSYGLALSISDLWDVLGAQSTDRDIISANGSNLSINVSELDLWFTAINFKNKKCPNQKTIASQSAPTLTRVWRDGAGFWSTDSSASIVPTGWDDNTGTPVALGQDQFQNLTFFIGPQDGAIFYFLGQEIYSSRAGSLAGVRQDRDKIKIDTFPRTLFYIGTITVRNDTTELNDSAQAVISEGQKVAKVYDNMVALGDGLIQNKVSVAFTHNGSNSQLVLTADDEEEIELQLDGVGLEMASPASINLIHGTATNPTENFVYITTVGSTPQLNVAQTKPTFDGVGLFANVWTGLVQDAVDLGTTNKFKATQEVIDYFRSPAQSWIRTSNDKHRAATTYESGLLTTLTPDVGGQDAVIDWAVTTGVVSQLSPHDVDAFDSTINTYGVPNDFTTPYVDYNGLEEITTDVNGTSFATNNRQWNLILWVAVGEEGDDAQYYVNPPDGFYQNDSVAAIADALTTSVTTFPAGFKGKGQLIGRVTLQYNGGLYTVLNFEDLTEASATGGGGGGGANAFTELSDTPALYTGSENYTVKVNAGGTGLEFVATGAGESNTISNVGTSGADLVDGKLGVDLQVRKLNSLSSPITIVADEPNQKVDVSFIAGNVPHSSIGSLQGGTTNEYWHLTQAEYNALGASDPLWSSKNSFLTSFTINEATDQNKWFYLGDTAAAERTITTDPTAGEKFNFWVSSDSDTYDVVIAGDSEVVDSQLIGGSDEFLSQGVSQPVKWGQLFNYSEFNKASFNLKKVASPTGTLYCRIYDITGTIGVDAIPTGSALEEVSIDVSTLTTSYQLIEFGFSNNYSGNKAISIEYSTGDLTNYVNIESDSVNMYGGNSAYEISAGWVYDVAGSLLYSTSLTETINGLPSVTISKDNANPVQAIKDGSDYKLFYYEEPAGGAGSTIQTMIVQDQKSSGVHGGTNTAGNQIRTLNTVVSNEIAGASLSSNQVTLPTGNYIVWARCPVYKVNPNKCSIVRVSGDSLTTIIGSSTSSDHGSTSFVYGRLISVTSGITIELHHYTNLSQSTTGLGYATSNGDVEVYSEMIIQKIG